MVVDAGPISTFTGATHNQVIPITQYTGTQLASVGTNGVSWSAFTWQGDNTLFMTRPRSSLNQQTTPWLRQHSPVQNGVVGQMATIPPGALDEFNLPVYPKAPPPPWSRRTAAVATPITRMALSYHDALAGSYGSAFRRQISGQPGEHHVQ